MSKLKRSNSVIVGPSEPTLNRETKAHIHMQARARVRSGVILRAHKRKGCKCPTAEWPSGLRARRAHQAVKSDGALARATAWRNPEQPATKATGARVQNRLARRDTGRVSGCLGPGPQGDGRGALTGLELLRMMAAGPPCKRTRNDLCVSSRGT